MNRLRYVWFRLLIRLIFGPARLRDTLEISEAENLPAGGPHRFVRGLCKLVLGLGRLLYKLEISGAENIPEHGACIVAHDHSSRLDVLMFAFMLQARPDVWFVLGWRDLLQPVLYRRLGVKALPVYLKPDSPALAIWTALKVLQKGDPVLISPEGAICWDGRLGPLKPGTAWLALRSGAPLIVCVLKGGYSVWPRWAVRPRLTGTVEIRIGKPVDVPQVYDRRIEGELVRTVSLKIADEMARLKEAG